MGPLLEDETQQLVASASGDHTNCNLSLPDPDIFATLEVENKNMPPSRQGMSKRRPTAKSACLNPSLSSGSTDQAGHPRPPCTHPFLPGVSELECRPPVVEPIVHAADLRRQLSIATTALDREQMIVARLQWHINFHSKPLINDSDYAISQWSAAKLGGLKEELAERQEEVVRLEFRCHFFQQQLLNLPDCSVAE